MYATGLHCFSCDADFPLSHRGSCPVYARAGEESALNETLGVRYDVATLKGVLDREELARRPVGLWRYHELLPVDDPAFRMEAETGWSFLHNFLAYQSDGDKTTAFEICEQLGWRVPAAVFVPIGNSIDTM